MMISEIFQHALNKLSSETLGAKKKKQAGKKAAYETVLDAILQPDGCKQSVKGRKQQKDKNSI